MKGRVASWHGPPFQTISLSSPSGTWTVNVWGEKWTWDRTVKWQNGKGGSWDPEKSWSNIYSFETSLRHHLVCFPAGASRLPEKRTRCITRGSEEECGKLEACKPCQEASHKVSKVPCKPERNMCRPNMAPRMPTCDFWIWVQLPHNKEENRDQRGESS